MTYHGRFAPSPTGKLHFGSLVAAVGSWLCARHAGGQWLVRMEDIDPPREVAGAAADILATLPAFGLVADAPPLYQSQRMAAYDAAFEQLREADLLFPCTCSRSQLAASGGVRRADGHYSYQLACVVDDAFQGITDVVRGQDLLESTARQIWLQRCLELPTPTYRHLPLVLDGAGAKLSKSTHALPVDPREPTPTLRRALAFLHQPLPSSVTGVEGLLAHALADFDPALMPHCSGNSVA